MSSSIFSTLSQYLRAIGAGIWSILGSCFTALPYLFGARDLTKEVTEQYPDPISAKTPDDLPTRTRGLLFNDIDRCTGCRECESQCPTACIRIEAEPAGDENKIWVSVFDIDHSRCIFCGICTDACLPGSLVHTREYEAAVFQLSDAVARFGRGWVTPEQRLKWATLRQQLEEESSTL